MNNVNLHNNITPILTVSLNTYSPSELGWIEISKTINEDEVVIDLKKKYPSPLHAALTLQDIDLIKKILDLNLPINLPDEIRGNTALNLAMVFSTEEIVLLLIEKGADIHKTSKQGWTYLHEAILRNMPVVVETLINQLDINAIAHLVDQSALSCSFLTNDPIDSSQTIPISPLYLAIRLNLVKINRQEIALLLLKKGADISFQHPKGVNLLHLAIANDYEEVCEILLKKKMDPDQGFQMHVDVKNLNCDEKYKTLAKPILDMSPLFLAVYKNSISLVRLLLNFGANFSNFNPIFVILDTCNKEMLKEFVDKGFRMDQEIFGLPIAISIENKIESLKLALELGANINHKFSEGNTYLHIAVTMGNLPLCKFLIEHGADINACNDEKNSILHEALIRINKNEELIIFLLSNGADARCVNLKGYTPLQYLDKLKLNTLSDNVKALLNASDKGLTSYLLQLRLLGLRFALKGKMFEGSNRHSTYQEIAVSLDKYLSAEKKNYAYLEPLKTSLQQSTSLSSEKILDLLKEKKQVTISLGWPGHEIIAILCDEFLMLGNRGDGCQESGLTLYKINDFKNLKDSIQALLNFKEVSYEPSIKIDEFFQNPNAISEERQKFDEVTIENAKAFIYKKLQEELHLDVIDSFPLKNQTVGNCTWMAAKMGLLGGLILTLHRENPTKSLKEIKKEAKQIYADWKQFDNLHSLEILKEVENDPLIKTLVDLK